MSVIQMRRRTLWTVTAQQFTYSGGGHFWFNTSNGFTSDATNIPVAAWLKIPCAGAKRLLLQFGAVVTAVGAAGITLVTKDELRAVAFGMPLVDPNLPGFEQPPGTRATATPAEISKMGGGLQLSIISGDKDSVDATPNGRAAADKSMFNGAGVTLTPAATMHFAAAGETPVATDYVAWTLEVGQEPLTLTPGAAPTATVPVTPQKLSVEGLAAVWIALKHTPAYTSGGSANTITLSGSLIALPLTDGAGIDARSADLAW